MGVHTIYLATKENDNDNYSLLSGREVHFFNDNFTLEDLPVYMNNIITFPCNYKKLNKDIISNSKNIKSIIILKCESNKNSKGLGNIDENEEFTAFLFDCTQINLNDETNEILVTFSGSDKNILAEVKAISQNEFEIIKTEMSDYNYSAVSININK